VQAYLEGYPELEPVTFIVNVAINEPTILVEDPKPTLKEEPNDEC
jgi:hypothetical protein